MSELQSVLVVEDGPAQRGIVSLLQDAGYRATGVSTFEQASQILEDDPPNALITELRLGAFNGLHLAIRSRSTCPDTVVVIHTAFPDRVLEAEAIRLGAEVLIRPVSPSTLLSTLSKLMVVPFERRAFVRKRVNRASAVQISDRSATLVDVSYHGFRVELHGGEIPAPFEIRLPTFAVAERARVIWAHRQAPDKNVLICGAVLTNFDSGREQAWRRVVDFT